MIKKAIHSGLIRHMSLGFGILAIGSWPLLLGACSQDVTTSNLEHTLWDTAFTVVGTSFPGDSILPRAIVETGNNYRLSKFFKKCSSLKNVKVGFIGGSITEGALATTTSSRYSSILCKFIGKSFPGTKFEEINAGIGATTSRLACSRAYDDLFIAKPDLIVIDFAVNDDISDSVTSSATIEGLIRQSLQYSDVPVIIYQTMNRFGDSINHIAQHRIAKHYDLPIVSFRNACWPLVKSERIPWNALSPDDVHPNDLGP